MFPSRMKIAKIIPLFKSGAKKDNGDDRPISLLPQFFSNHLERLFLSRLDNFVNARDILISSQYGFRVSTSHAIMKLTEDISNATNNKKYVICVSIDLMKAFDTVNHEIIIKKISMVCVELKLIG